jgi:two-component system, chemotaxis family, CheB/CheR fusion protein
VQGGVRLRETLNQLERVEGALVESESRHAFLLRLGDAVRPLTDPLSIQEETSRRLGEQLLIDGVSYAAIDDARGCLLVERQFARAGVSNTVAQSLSQAFNGVSPELRKGRPVVVSNTRTSPLMADADHPALAALGVRAFVAAPLIRDGRLVAALCVSTCVPRAWTPEDVGLIRDTAERTWEVIERAHAEVRLLEADARKDEFLAMLAHELRNPLAPIRTGLELIRRGGDTVMAVERVRAMMERQVGTWCA